MTEPSSDRPAPARTETRFPSDATHTANRLTLEIVFLAFVALVVLWAFVEALGYSMVSARTPFVIMAPLFVLIVVHARNLWRARGEANFGERMREGLTGQIVGLNATLRICLWLVILMAMIVVLGHYIAVAAFCFVLMRVLARESSRLAVIVTLAATAMIWLVFEVGFDVELYRGLVIRYFQGYRDF